MVDTELNEILLKTDEPVSDSAATHYNSQLLGQVEQQVKQPQGRDDIEVLATFILSAALLLTWS